MSYVSLFSIRFLSFCTFRWRIIFFYWMKIYYFFKNQDFFSFLIYILICLRLGLHFWPNKRVAYSAIPRNKMSSPIEKIYISTQRISHIQKKSSANRHSTIVYLHDYAAIWKRQWNMFGLHTKGENTHFLFLFFSEPVGGFQSNSVGIILRGKDQRLFMWSMLPLGGPRGRVPQGENKKFVFQTINHYSQDTCILYVDIFIDEEYKLFMARPVIHVPLWAGGGGQGEKHFHFLQNQWVDFTQTRFHPNC